MRIVRSVISSVIEGAIKLFSGSGLIGETFTKREFFQHFGFTSIPPAGSEGLVLVIGNRVFMFASDNRDLRPAIEDGEACLYIDKLNWIKIQADKTIQINSENNVEIIAAENTTVTAKNITGIASVQAQITAPVVNIIAATAVLVQSPMVSLGVSGFLALMTSAFVELFNNHTHSSGPPPDVPAVIGTHTTVNTLAS